MKTKRKIIEIDEELCNGCGKCVLACAEGAIEIVNGKARLVSESFCDGLAACLGECPENALKIIEREAETFDMQAVTGHMKKHSAHQANSGMEDCQSVRAENIFKVLNREGRLMPDSGCETVNAENLPCGCPSVHMQSFSLVSEKLPDEKVDHEANLSSYLTHWPVKIKLVPAGAMFLKNANIVVAADCTPVAYPDFHRDFLKDNVILIGCPKFDDVKGYVSKFAEIFKTANIGAVTILIMDVPCCSRLPSIVNEGMMLSGKKIPTEVIVINARGKVLENK